MYAIDIAKKFGRFNLLITKGLPNLIDAGFIAVSIFSQEPKYLAGIGIGEVLRIYLKTTYEETKDKLKQDIGALEELIDN